MTPDQLWERLEAASRMPFGRGQIAAVEEVIRHADALGEEETQYAARILATHAYTYGAEPAKAFVTFSWCLAAYDRGAGLPRYDQELYWYFKWMVSALTKFPEVPLARTFAALDEMERRYRLAGHTMNPVHQYRTVVAMHVGDLDTAREQYRLWCAAPRGEMSDCVGCEPSDKVRYLSQAGRDEEAVALALPVLGGELSCVEQPQSILTALLLPYLRTGRLEEAVDAHRQAYRAIRHNRGELGMVADHIAFCAYTGNTARGLELVERHLGWLDEPRDPMADMHFSAAAALVLRLVAESGRADLPVRGSTAGALRDELAGRALELAQRFDTRNETPAQGDRIRALLSAAPIVDHLPLSGPVRPAPQPAAAEPSVLPDTPEELVAFARREAWLGNRPRRIWQRFDELCPDPEPALLAHRLVARGSAAGRDDVAAAEPHWLRAAELFAEVGAEVHRQGLLARLAVLRKLTGRDENVVAEVAGTVETVARIGTADDHAQALVRLAYAHRVAEQPQEALTALEQAAELATDDALRAHIALETAHFTVALGPDRYPAALAAAERAIALFEPVGPCDGLREAQRLAAQLCAEAGDPERAAGLLDTAALAEDPLLRAQAQHDRGRLGLDLGQAEAAHRALAAAVAGFAAVDETMAAAVARIDLAAAAVLAGVPEEAADAAETAISELTATRRTAEHPAHLDAELARARFQLARAYRELGHPDQAVELLDLVAAHCQEQDNPAGVGQMHGVAGEVLDEFDREAEAAERFGLAADSYASAELALPELDNRRRAALSWHWADDLDRSLAALAAAEAVADRLADDPDAVWHLAILGYDGGRILANAPGRLADALHRVVPAADRFRSVGAIVQAGIADALHGRILVDLDRPGEAEKLLTAALEALPADATGPREDIRELLDSITSAE
ncbi:hypothetical protein [Actinophytocola sp.]|uniref:hypothetical protein n=1 Tax=Actinophytocola sp. TaxID=1872138 RepID=UPI002D7E48DE|nr:hypothetical protein [Actinophytocola sp.]HET9138467.1 hypothetical protein [Actinophytocola sp.]